MEIAIDAGQLHTCVEEMQVDRDAWRPEAEWLTTRRILTA